MYITVGWIILVIGCIYALSRNPEFRASLRYQEAEEDETKT